MAVDISTSLLFTDNENDTNKQCNIHRDTLLHILQHLAWDLSQF